jgi:hypothetical protein
MGRLIVACCLLMAACKGIPESEFIGAYEDLYCSGYVLCATDEMLRTVGQRECLQYFPTQTYPDPPECTYDRVAAEQCLAELATSGCEGDDPEVPVACDGVYDGCEYPRLPLSEGPELSTSPLDQPEDDGSAE